MYRLQKLYSRCARVIKRYKNEAGQSEEALCHLGWNLLSERRIHINARQMFKVLHDLAPATDSCSANDYHLRNADNKLVSYNGAKSGIPYRMKFVVVKLE